MIINSSDRKRLARYLNLLIDAGHWTVGGDTTYPDNRTKKEKAADAEDRAHALRLVKLLEGNRKRGTRGPGPIPSVSISDAINRLSKIPARRHLDMEWVEAHRDDLARSHPDQYVAVQVIDGKARLVGTGADLVALYNDLSSRGFDMKTVLFDFIQSST